ncbi:MAG: HDOD domain-containing protein [Desulfobacterales bacterium]|nr:HDOD domain-containing protein [Deltaproteobacteria bacterium]NNK85661.1 HDOD domain-containing protein [Desulfobacterales bacterium]NNL41074.1 HDOD domain-containing protein [Desulfobacterales bacterium]
MEDLNIIAKVEAFPSLPAGTTKLLSLLDDSNAAVAEIEEILRMDPGLTANVLKLSNSAYFGFPSEIGSVHKAIVLLGAKRLIQLVMASCVNSVMNKAVPGYDLSPGEMWRHSIAVSVAAEGLIQELNATKADEIFTAALLHDVGKLVLGEFVKDDIKKIEKIASKDVSFEVAEQIALGTDHAEIGAQILKSWGLPSQIVNAVRWHHNPDATDESSTLVDIVHVANVLCLMIGIGVGREGLQYRPSPEVTERLGIKSVHLEKVASHTLGWVSDLTDIYETNQESKD